MDMVRNLDFNQFLTCRRYYFDNTCITASRARDILAWDNLLIVTAAVMSKTDAEHVDRLDIPSYILWNL